MKSVIATLLILLMGCSSSGEKKILVDTSAAQLVGHIESFKGDKPIFFNVYDSEKKVKLTLNSKKIKVKIIPELLSQLEDHEWFYKLN